MARHRSAQDDTYQRILEIAGARFMTYGFSRTTMDELASQLGMSKKTLYRYFGTKHEMVQAVVDAHLDHVRTQLLVAFENDELPMVDRLTRILHTVSRQLARLGEPFLSDLARYAPDIWEDVERFREEQVFSRLEGLLAEGIAEGLVKRDVQPAVVVRIISTIARGLVTPSVLTELELRPESVVETLASMMYGGILTERGRERMIETEDDDGDPR